jgi:ribonuclease E
MTPDEQRVYAEMGISPLVLSDEEVQEARNTLISVVLPGEKSNTTANDSASMAKPVKTEVADPVPNANATPAPGGIEKQESGGSSAPTTKAAADASSAASTEEPKVRRRRRRRSSASSDNSEE